jgi:hypothetical protein
MHNRPTNNRKAPSPWIQLGAFRCVGNQSRKPFVHVILVVAVKKHRAGIIGDKVNLGGRVSRH